MTIRVLTKRKKIQNDISVRFEIELENTCAIEIQNGMNCIHGNKVNKIAECALLHDILNPPKHTKTLNIHYYPIIHGCMNT